MGVRGAVKLVVELAWSDAEAPPSAGTRNSSLSTPAGSTQPCL